MTLSTAVSYRGLLECCVLDRVVDVREVGLGDLPLTALTPMRIGEWLADLQHSGLSASRVRKAYRVLSLAMDAAVRDRRLPTNPCGKHHRLPRLPEHEPTILTVDQVESLVANLRYGSEPCGRDRSSCQPIRPDPALASIVEVLAYGSLRIGEALALRRRHVDVLGCKLVVAESLTEVDGQFSFGSTKTHQVREVPLPRSLLVELERHPDTEAAGMTDALLFTSTTGGPVRYRSLRRSFDAACRRVGLVDVTPHSLRASCASLGGGERRCAGGRAPAGTQPLKRYHTALRTPDDRRRHRRGRPPRQSPTGRPRGRGGGDAASPDLARSWHDTRIAPVEGGSQGRAHSL